MSNAPNFTERRKEHRLPFADRVILTDGKTSMPYYAANISRGGLFLLSLEPYPIQTLGHMIFCLPCHPVTISVKVKVAHIVFDKQRCEVECGMGVQFMDMDDDLKALMNLHMMNEKANYLEMKNILKEESPDPIAVARTLRKMPWLSKYDLLGLRYKVNRICTIFENDPPAADMVPASPPSLRAAA